MRFRQFRIWHLLILIAVSAIAIVVWLNFVYVHPTHQIPLYEKAPYSRSGRMTIDGTSISIKSVARNERDGTLLVEDGFGRAITSSIPHSKLLGSSAAWLDAAQIELAGAPGEFEVFDVRIFDSETREIIDEVNRASGKRMIDPETLQIYRLGARLPDTVDVFLRLNVHRDGETKRKIEPEAGAEVSLGPGRGMAIGEIARGYTSWSSTGGFVTDPKNRTSDFAMIFQFVGDWSSSPAEARRKYQLVTVLKDGTRLHDFRFFRSNSPREVVTVSANLDDVDHFEIRPFGGRHRFFFEGVRLPKTSTAKFQPPPSPRITLEESKNSYDITELAPLKVSVTLVPGRVTGTSSRSGQQSQVGLDASEEGTSIICRQIGITDPGWSLVAFPASGEANGTEGEKPLFSHGGGSSNGSGQSLQYRHYQVDRNQIGSVELELP